MEKFKLIDGKTVEKTELRFVWITDEECDVLVDGAYVGNLTYDTYGWNGMSEVRDILSSVARLKGWEISVAGDAAI